jgi:hypothetical protein
MFQAIHVNSKPQAGVYKHDSPERICMEPQILKTSEELKNNQLVVKYDKELI